MTPEFRLRRPPPFDPASVPSDPVLVERIAAEIEAGGPMTFARFMELALYDPERGYYRSAEARPGRAGDFLTAPEAHPIYGHSLARQLVEVWNRLDRPDPFTVREPGAGEGALARAILDGLAADGSPLLEAIRYQPVEVDPRRGAAFEANLGAAGHGRRIDAGVAIDGSAGPPIVGAVVANEVIDALPIHRVVARDGALREVRVGWSGGAFVDVEGEPSTPALAARLAAEGVELADGQRAEICLAIDGWLAKVAGWLTAGLLLVVDYGHPAAELYGPRRRDGTLRAYVRHHVHGDPYRHVGRQDLTAHVDLSAVERAAVASGLVPLGSTTQAAFLLGCGLEELLEAIRADPATTAEAWLTVRGVVLRLLDPAAMGRFRVLGFGRGLAIAPPLRGFAARPPEPTAPRE